MASTLVDLLHRPGSLLHTPIRSLQGINEISSLTFLETFLIQRYRSFCANYNPHLSRWLSCGLFEPGLDPGPQLLDRERCLSAIHAAQLS